MNAEIARFDQLRAQISSFVQPTEMIVVSDKATEIAAGGALKTVKDFLKEIESRRVEAVQPLNDRAKELNAYAKDIAAPLLKAEVQIKQKIGAWANAERVRLETERRELEEQRLAEQRRLDEARREREVAITAACEAEWRAIEEKASAESAAAKKKQEAESEARKAFGASAANDARIAADESARISRVAEEQRAAELRAAEASEALRLEQERAAKEQELAAHRAARAAEAARPKNLRRVVKFEVLDPLQIPREYLEVNESAIRKALQTAVSAETVLLIPGVKWHVDFEVIAR